MSGESSWAFAFAFFLGFAFVHAAAPPNAASNPTSYPVDYRGIEALIQPLDQAVTEQRESEALALAVRILRGIPIEAALEPEQRPDVTIYNDHRPERLEALRALRTFHALDEYKRKVKAYYHEDTKNPTYDELMAEISMVDDPKAETPFLEEAHKINPDDMLVVGDLAVRYHDEGRNQELYDLIDPILVEDKPVLGGLEVNLLELYTQMGQLPRLAHLAASAIKPFAGWKLAPPYDPFDRPSLDRGDLEAALEKAHLTAERLELARAEMIGAPPPNRDEETRVYLRLLAESGNVDDFAKTVANHFFPPGPPDRYNSSTPGIGLGMLSEPATDENLKLLREAVEKGALPHLKSTAKSYLTANPKNLTAAEVYAFILVLGRDPEALTYLPVCSQQALASTKSIGGAPDGPFSALFNELLSWPDARALLQPTLETAWKLGLIAQPQSALLTNIRIAQLALKIPNQGMAQEVLRKALDLVKNPPPAPLPTSHSFPAMDPRLLKLLGPPFHLPIPSRPNSNYDYNPSADWAAKLADGLAEVGLFEEAAAVVALIADPAKTAINSYPSNRPLIIAKLAETELDAGRLPFAKICAQTALQRLQHDWLNPQQTSHGFTMPTGISPDEVRLIAQVLSRLDMGAQLTDLVKLLQQPTSSGVQIDTKPLLTDIQRFQGFSADPPQGLTPAIWVDQSVPANGSDQQVAWDMTARMPGNGRFGCNQPFSVEGYDTPQLKGKLALQILAGPMADNLRQVKNLSAVDARGTTQVTLQPTDRFITAFAQTMETQPHVFTGFPVAMSTEPNLFPEAALANRFVTSVDYTASSMMRDAATSVSAPVTSVPGGPTVGGSYREIVTGSFIQRVELDGGQQPIQPDTVYLFSGWIRGGGQFGVRYLDKNGQKIIDNTFYSPGSSEDWQWVTHRIGNSRLDQSVDSTAPQTAMSLEPLIVAENNATLDFSNVYFGMTTKSSDAVSSPEQAVIMDGLAGAVSIGEAPQGNVLAAAFQNGDVRCFDLTTHQEIGIASHLSSPAVEVAFFDHGRSIIAADKAGDVLVRSTDGTTSGTIIYHAPWQIDFLSASSDASVAAVGCASGNVVGFNATNGAGLFTFTLESPPLGELIVSPDGKHVYVRPERNRGEVWQVASGQKENIDFSGPPPSNGGWFNEWSLARLFQIPRLLKVSREWWLQTDTGIAVQSEGTGVVYSVLGMNYRIHRFETGTFAAFCPSTQNHDLYTVSSEGKLSVWKVPVVIKFPTIIEPPSLAFMPTPASPTGANGTPASVPAITPSEGALSIRASDHLRGFPKTTLSQPLKITVFRGGETPAADIELEIHSDLAGARFASAGLDGARPKESLRVKTDATGKASVVVTLGPKAGKNVIHIDVTSPDKAASISVPLEAIDENAPLNKPYDLVITPQPTVDILLTWKDDPDNRTANLIYRTVNDGPRSLIAVLPETATTYTDMDVRFYDLHYAYWIGSSNEPKWGYPAKMPPPSDRLGEILRR